MIKIDKLHFGTAGIPISSPKKNSIDGLKTVKSLGLDGMELEFVRGVKMGFSMADQVRSVAAELGILLSVHAPYYINFNSSDREKVKASAERLIQSARVGYRAGAFSVVFHAGYYGSSTPYKAYNRIRDALKGVVRTIADEGIDIWIRPETMGGLAEFGDLQEVIKLSEELEGVLPAIDFAHLHARSIGKINTYQDFAKVLELLEARLGRVALDQMHIHVSGIEYGSRGEIKHLNLRESDLNYEAVLKALKDFRVKGILISESPNIEEDAILMRDTYMKL